MNSQMKLQKRFATQIWLLRIRCSSSIAWFEYCRDLHHQPASSSSFAYYEGSSPFQLILTLLFFGVCWSLKTREKVNHVFAFRRLRFEPIAKLLNDDVMNLITENSFNIRKFRRSRDEENETVIVGIDRAMLNIFIRLLSDLLSRNWWAKDLWMHFTYHQQHRFVVKRAEPHFRPINHVNMLHRMSEKYFHWG